ncbi:MAG: ORF6N domain-containing protein [Prevotella sp.]|nr:ORF6N domain-containing protein [Prevotella sp.]
MGEKEKQIKRVESRLVNLRDKQVIIDRDVAELYGVGTKEVNQALRNNPDKFPYGYVITLEKREKDELVKNFDRFNPLKHSTVAPHAFTEQGLYMLATILKSPTATQTTIAIIETFTKLRILARGLQHINDTIAAGGVPSEKEQNTVRGMMNNIFKDPLPVRMQKFTFGLNLGFVKFSMETTKEKI